MAGTVNTEPRSGVAHPQTAPDGGHTARLSRFIAEFAPASLPPAVADRMNALILDGIGAIVAATNPAFSTGRLIADFVRSQGGEPTCTVIGQPFRSSPTMAVLANGTLGYACDIEPHHPEAILHPVAVMVPTALAIGELVSCTGAEFIAAAALGLEVEYRVSMALGPAGLYARGFHPSAVCGAFGAAATAAYLLRLDPSAVERALGLAACQASGTMAWESDPTENARPFQMGMAARNGVTAALLARSGFGGPAAIFDQGHTPFRAYSRTPDPKFLTAGLGAVWDGVMEMAIKPYSCVSFLHPGLDALFALIREHGLAPLDLAEIVLRFPTGGVHCVDGNPLKSHCAQYILPVAIANGRLRVEDIFVDRRLENRLVAELAERVRVVADNELDRLFPEFYASVIELTTASGQRFVRRNDVARGYPETPLDPAEIEEKFRTLVSSVSDQARTEALLAEIRELPSALSLNRLTALLAAPAKASTP